MSGQEGSGSTRADPSPAEPSPEAPQLGAPQPAASFPTGAIPPGNRPLADGLREVALELDRRCDAILRSDLALDDEGIHVLRVATKRLRAYWQLVKPIVGKTLANESIDRLRTSARALAARRDEHVLRGLLLHMATTSPDLVPREVERAAELIPPGASATPADHHAFLETVERDLAAWSGLEPIPDDELLAVGFRRAFSRGRKLGRAALVDHDARALHRWRRWVKYLRYQVEPFAMHGRDFTTACRAELARLGSLLGKRNDLHNLASALEGETLPSLEAAIRRREEEIEALLPRFEDSVYGLGKRDFLAELGRDLAL